jgi:oxygen-independent coproporphyrinogen-3 oxidase
MLDSSVSRVGGLYVHVPFCAQKCAYCAFYSEASSGDLINRYVVALLREGIFDGAIFSREPSSSAAMRPHC